MRAAVVGLFCLLLPVVARATEYDSVVSFYAATPFSAPAGFAWVPLLYFGLLIVTNSLLIQRLWGLAAEGAISSAVISSLVIWGGGWLLAAGGAAASFIPIAVTSSTLTFFLAGNAGILVFVVVALFALSYFFSPDLTREQLSRALWIPLWIIVGFFALPVLLSCLMPTPVRQFDGSLIGVLIGLGIIGMVEQRTPIARIAILAGINAVIYAGALIPYLLAGAFKLGSTP